MRGMAAATGGHRSLQAGGFMFLQSGLIILCAAKFVHLCGHESEELSGRYNALSRMSCIFPSQQMYYCSDNKENKYGENDACRQVKGLCGIPPFFLCLFSVYFSHRLPNSLLSEAQATFVCCCLHLLVVKRRDVEDICIADGI